MPILLKSILSMYFLKLYFFIDTQSTYSTFSAYPEMGFKIDNLVILFCPDPDSLIMSSVICCDGNVQNMQLAKQ